MLVQYMGLRVEYLSRTQPLQKRRSLKSRSSHVDAGLQLWFFPGPCLVISTQMLVANIGVLNSFNRVLGSLYYNIGNPIRPLYYVGGFSWLLEFFGLYVHGPSTLRGWGVASFSCPGNYEDSELAGLDSSRMTQASSGRRIRECGLSMANAFSTIQSRQLLLRTE